MKVKKHLLAAAVTLIVAAVGYYFTLPAISIHNPDLLWDIAILAIIYRLTLSFGSVVETVRTKNFPSLQDIRNVRGLTMPTKVTVLIVAACH